MLKCHRIRKLDGTNWDRQIYIYTSIKMLVKTDCIITYMYLYEFAQYIFKGTLNYRDGRGAEAQGCECNATVVGSIPTRGNVLLFINICISSLWHQDKCPAFGAATHYAVPRKIQRKERFRGFLCLPCYVRDIT